MRNPTLFQLYKQATKIYQKHEIPHTHQLFKQIMPSCPPNTVLYMLENNQIVMPNKSKVWLDIAQHIKIIETSSIINKANIHTNFAIIALSFEEPIHQKNKNQYSIIKIKHMTITSISQYDGTAFLKFEKKQNIIYGKQLLDSQIMTNHNVDKFDQANIQPISIFKPIDFVATHNGPIAMALAQYYALDYLQEYNPLNLIPTITNKPLIPIYWTDIIQCATKKQLVHKKWKTTKNAPFNPNHYTLDENYALWKWYNLLDRKNFERAKHSIHAAHKNKNENILPEYIQHLPSQTNTDWIKNYLHLTQLTKTKNKKLRLSNYAQNWTDIGSELLKISNQKFDIRRINKTTLKQKQQQLLHEYETTNHNNTLIDKRYKNATKKIKDSIKNNPSISHPNYPPSKNIRPNEIITGIHIITTMKQLQQESQLNKKQITKLKKDMQNGLGFILSYRDTTNTQSQLNKTYNHVFITTNDTGELKMTYSLQEQHIYQANAQNQSIYTVTRKERIRKNGSYYTRIILPFLDNINNNDAKGDMSYAIKTSSSNT